MTTIEQQILSAARVWVAARRASKKVGHPYELTRNSPLYGDARALRAEYDLASDKLVAAIEKLETK